MTSLQQQQHPRCIGFYGRTIHVPPVVYKAQLVIKDVRSLHPSLSSVLHRPPPVVVYLKQQQLSLISPQQFSLVHHFCIGIQRGSHSLPSDSSIEGRREQVFI